MLIMKRAYTLLGLCFILVGVGAYVSLKNTKNMSIIKTIEVTHTLPITQSQKRTDASSTDDAFSLTSPSFNDNGILPVDATCDGKGVNPPLYIRGVPAGTKSLALLLDDPDIPQVVKDSKHIESYDHWVLYNIAPDTSVIQEGASVGLPGVNSAGSEGYTSPCPPKQYEPSEHRYIFRLYALKGALTFTNPPTLKEVEDAASAQSLGTATLVGKYERP